MISVTRFGDYLHFGQPFKAGGNNQFTHIVRQFCKGVKIIQFSIEFIFGQLLQTFGDFYLVTLLMIEMLERTNSKIEIRVIGTGKQQQLYSYIGRSYIGRYWQKLPRSLLSLLYGESRETRITWQCYKLSNYSNILPTLFCMETPAKE